MSLPGANPRIPEVKVPFRQTFACALLLGLMLPVNGCSSFNRKWKAAADQGNFNRTASRWEGSWRSGKNGHHGQLRCLLTPESSTNSRAHFKATYWKIFRATYQVEFTGELRDGVWQFSGTEDLGWFAGGVYSYEGRVSPTNFFSTYKCKYDHGTFEMKSIP